MGNFDTYVADLKANFKGLMKDGDTSFIDALFFSIDEDSDNSEAIEAFIHAQTDFKVALDALGKATKQI